MYTTICFFFLRFIGQFVLTILIIDAIYIYNTTAVCINSFSIVIDPHCSGFEAFLFLVLCLYSIGDDTNAHQCDKKIVASHNSQSLDIVGLDFLVISNPSRAKTTPVVMISFCPLSAIPPNIAMPAPEAKMP